jgi:hypothetical protein
MTIFCGDADTNQRVAFRARLALSRQVSLLSGDTGVRYRNNKISFARAANLPFNTLDDRTLRVSCHPRPNTSSRSASTRATAATKASSSASPTISESAMKPRRAM